LRRSARRAGRVADADLNIRPRFQEQADALSMT
jgi:hypothetical protein